MERTETASGAGPPPATAFGAPRAVATLLGAGVAGLLLWVATQVGTKSDGEYWGTYGILAGAGLVLALSQLLGGWTKWGMPRLAPLVFLFGFVPTLIVGAWILVADQPHANTFGTHVATWSSNIGVLGLVHDLGHMLGPIALGVGLVFGFTFDTTGPRMRYAGRDVERARVAPAPMDRESADEPVTAERAAAADRDTAYAHAGTPAAPQPEPAPRTAPPDDSA